MISHNLDLTWPMIANRFRWAELVGVATFTTFMSLAPVPSASAASTAPGRQQLLDEAIGGRCVPEAAKQVLRSYRERIATAATVEEARALVLTQTRLARTALSTAAWMLPFSDSVRTARGMIDSLEQRVYAANTQVEVANDFSALIALPTRSDGSAISGVTGDSPLILADVDVSKTAVDVNTGHGGGCEYTTGEIIIIVLGFLLFIIPGIIFLIIFC